MAVIEIARRFSCDDVIGFSEAWCYDREDVIPREQGYCVYEDGTYVVFDNRGGDFLMESFDSAHKAIAWLIEYEDWTY